MRPPLSKELWYADEEIEGGKYGLLLVSYKDNGASSVEFNERTLVALHPTSPLPAPPHSGIELEISAYSPFLRDDEAITPLIVHL